MQVLDPTHSERGQPSLPEVLYSAAEQQLLLSVARQAIVCAVRGLEMPEVHPSGEHLQEKHSSFVTLTCNDKLRGCMGNILGDRPVYLGVMDNARNAAFRDPRFPGVQPDEIEQLRIEISILCAPQALTYTSPEELLALLHPHEHGVLLQFHGRVATFLPQVWEQVPDKVKFLQALCAKAGVDHSAWRSPEAEILVYRVQHFQEDQPVDCNQ